jgi:protein TonB
MRLGWLFGMAAAVLAFVSAVAFEVLVLHKDEKEPTPETRIVDLLGELKTDDPDKKKEEEPEEPRETTEELESPKEEPPDAAELLRNLDATPIDSTPALEAASLSAIEAALNGQRGGGDFADALSFNSGGRIGATGVAGPLGDATEEVLTLAEIDQEPRAIYQESPSYPREMRGKKTEGLVTLVFVVDATGKVKNPRVEDSSHAAFESPALNAVKRWKFEPGLRAGQRVASKIRISIRFPAS